MLVNAQERAEAEGRKQSTAPPMSTWSAEVEALTAINDKLGSLIYITRAANNDKSAKPPPPAERPATALAGIRAEHRQQRHEKLTARLIRR